MRGLSQKELADILSSKHNQHPSWSEALTDFTLQCSACKRAIINMMAVDPIKTLNLECSVVQIKLERERIANYSGGEYAICNLEEEFAQYG